MFRRDKDMKGSVHPTDHLLDRDPWCKTLFPDFRELKADELPQGYQSGSEFTSVCINTATYLQWLLGQCLKNGVTVKRAVLSDISEAKTMSHTGSLASIVVNATGLGSLKLVGVNDTTLTPARGQIVLVRNEGPIMLGVSGTDDGSTEDMYVMQRAGGGGTILGGTYDIGNWNANPDPNIALRIMKRVVNVFPSIAGGKGIEGLDVIRHGVGLRPLRKDGVRIESEKLDESTWLVHNYGHAGWGYQASYGCAERVVELVDEIKQRSVRGSKL
ncbi:D-amino acid oxidase [Fusarium falciforme]|uniref:D-amino acid oxidase n=1 Tax=Fusarium falciforme TaxID=195108 RepID=A0A9W8R2M6_9HYPO|nr:D-amino acid oxidase [Fusarium falciforme]KAJ4183160.1 D-amino acid oxidase [Fusarium falciforme]